MKIFKTGILVFAVVSFLAAHTALASPDKGTSAYAAARLKNHPPDTWIKHYLPDDRYKIKGKIWKYVSTVQDKYFHHPDSPEMLRQSPNNVIGFPSRAAAEEAGYLPGNDIISTELQIGYSRHQAPSDIRSVVDSFVSKDITNQTKSDQWITLADGASKILLPVGWGTSTRIYKSSSSSGASQNYMQPLHGEKAGILVSIMWGPDSLAEETVKDIPYRILYNEYVRSGRWKVDSKTKAAENNLIIHKTSIDGASGFTMTSKDGKPLSTKSVMMDVVGYTMTSVAKNGKAYSLLISAKETTAEIKKIIGSFKPR